MTCSNKKAEYHECKELMQLIERFYVNEKGKVIGGKYFNGQEFELNQVQE